MKGLEGTDSMRGVPKVRGFVWDSGLKGSAEHEHLRVLSLNLPAIALAHCKLSTKLRSHTYVEKCFRLHNPAYFYITLYIPIYPYITLYYLI